MGWSTRVASANSTAVLGAEFCRNFGEETSRVEPGLDPANSIVKDEVSMNILRLDSRLTAATDYLGRLKAVMARIDAALWRGVVQENDLESMMT